MESVKGGFPTTPFKRICVFTGSSPGKSPEYVKCAEALGEALVKRNIGLVYGGGSVGLMGALANTVAKGLGHDGVVGVIPEGLCSTEISGAMVGETRVVKNMHKRKELMAELADAFVVLPGGFGTLEEMLEVVTWHQLGYHRKPIGVLNVGGFYDSLLGFFDHLVQEGFVQDASRKIVVQAEAPNALLDLLRDYQVSSDLPVVVTSEQSSGGDTSV
ncbi:hypothetical protein BSKO_09291 [Bryopsis sp. KO-2023]|nr:hypothetical protein BSKO_09291 [Bryopsis sp. KO-2023]